MNLPILINWSLLATHTRAPLNIERASARIFHLITARYYLDPNFSAVHDQWLLHVPILLNARVPVDIYKVLTEQAILLETVNKDNQLIIALRITLYNHRTFPQLATAHTDNHSPFFSPVSSPSPSLHTYSLLQGKCLDCLCMSTFRKTNMAVSIHY